jgi:IS5 family transposase
MSQPRDDRQDDLFRPPLEEIINLRHPLVRLAGEIDWDFLALPKDTCERPTAWLGM